MRVYRRKRVHAQLLEALRNGTLDENMLDSAILKRWPRGEKIAHKDIKMRTFITQEKAVRSWFPTYMTSLTAP
ncbi:hypothetical protein M5E88_04305 [Akkermansia muciniphila]|nr:hypothetical protein M5E88_04305 [Akkermansia muciniphila]